MHFSSKCVYIDDIFSLDEPFVKGLRIQGAILLLLNKLHSMVIARHSWNKKISAKTYRRCTSTLVCAAFILSLYFSQRF